MQDGYIRLGDPTTSSGRVIEASGFPSNGLNFAYENDNAMCPLHGIVAMVDGYSGWLTAGDAAGVNVVLGEQRCQPS